MTDSTNYAGYYTGWREGLYTISEIREKLGKIKRKKIFLVIK